MKSKILIVAMLLISSISLAQVNPNVVVKDKNKTKFTTPVVKPPIDSDAMKCENLVHSNFRDIVSYLNEDNSRYVGYKATITLPGFDTTPYTVHGEGFAFGEGGCNLEIKNAYMYSSNNGFFNRSQAEKTSFIFDMRGNTLKIIKHSHGNASEIIRNLKRVGLAFYGFDRKGLPIVIQLRKNPRLG